MTQADSPLKRSIGFSGVSRFQIVVTGVVAVCAAFVEGIVLGVGATLVVVTVVGLGYRAHRAWLSAGSIHRDGDSEPGAVQQLAEVPRLEPL